MYSYGERLVALKELGVQHVGVFKVSNDRPIPIPGAKMAGAIELPVQNDQGFLVEVNSKTRHTFALTVEIGRLDDVCVVWTEGHSRTIKDLRDQTPEAGTASFVKRIPTDRSANGDWVTKSTDNIGNSAWVVSVANGQLQMWEVAIVTRIMSGISKIYLSLQKVYEATMFKMGRKPKDLIFIPHEQFPGYADWESLQTFLNKRVNVCKLPSTSKYKKPVDEQPVSLSDGEAEIIWFNQAKGFGFAHVNGEQASPIIHWTAVADQDSSAFAPGQIVRYSSISRNGRGVQLIGVTSSRSSDLCKTTQEVSNQ